MDAIEGLSPAIAIGQKTTGRNPRSTVGTVTEVYDHLRLLYAHIGRPHCHECGEPVHRQTPQRIVDMVLGEDEGTRHAAPGRHRALTGSEHVDTVVQVDQTPIGRSPRSNPATYTGLFEQVRALFAQTPEAKVRGYRPGRFSFDVKGGRCESCHGDGTVRVEMNFLPDVYIPCETCRGAPYNRETLEIRYKGRSIADVLGMTVEEGLRFFEGHQIISRHLRGLDAVGLGCIRLGQPATTLSGGEAQRVKLAAELQRHTRGRSLYVLDEPTTGLHVADVEKLLPALQRLVDGGNTVVVIEHNLDVITPEQVAAHPDSHTGRYLRPLLESA